MTALDLVNTRDELLRKMSKGVYGPGQDMEKEIQRNVRLANAANRLEVRLSKILLKTPS